MCGRTRSANFACFGMRRRRAQIFFSLRVVDMLFRCRTTALFLLSVLIPRTWLIGFCILGVLVICLRPLGKLIVANQQLAVLAPLPQKRKPVCTSTHIAGRRKSTNHQRQARKKHFRWERRKQTFEESSERLACTCKDKDIAGRAAVRAHNIDEHIPAI